MIALVATAVLPALFIASGAFALAVLAGTWRRYAGAYRRLGLELALCDAARPVTVRVARPDLHPAPAPVRPARRSPVLPRPAMAAALCVAA